MSLLEWLKDIVASLNESPEAKAELEDLRKEIAKGYLEKLEKEKPDILLMFAKDQVLDFMMLLLGRLLRQYLDFLRILKNLEKSSIKLRQRKSLRL